MASEQKLNGSDNNLAKQLAKEFEDVLIEFLNLSWIEQLEKAEKFFSDSAWYSRNSEQFQKISLMFKDLKENDFEVFFKNSDEEFKEFIQFCKSSYSATYFQHQFQAIIERLPYYFLFSHIIFPKTYIQINYDQREHLREICGLKTPSQRKDAFLNLFSFLIPDEVKQGGSEGFWNEANSLYFVSWYNRFQIVIKNARNDLENLKDTETNRLEILKKYAIPNEYKKDTFGTLNPAEVSLKWALRLVDWIGDDPAKALRTAKEKAGDKVKYKSQGKFLKLISVYKLNLNNVITQATLLPKSRSLLRYKDLFTDDHTMLYYI